jgi:DNA repair exonuclease SbcCD ATPase subunit
MRFNHIIAREIGTFRELRVDFNECAGPLVAITGPNGAGKSTMLELLMAGVDRRTATRGSLVDLARSRDGFLEVGFAHGGEWTTRHTVDAVSGKGESLVLDGAGKSVLDDAKVRTFDAWSAANMPSREVLESSLIAVQGSHGFLDLSAGARKAVLLRVIGIERLEKAAEEAREWRREAMGHRDRAEAALAEVRGEDVAQVEKRLADARAELATATTELEAAEKTLVTMQEVEARAVDAERAWKTHETALREAQARVDALEVRAKNNRAALADEVAIRDAIAEKDRAQKALDDAEEKLRVARAEMSASALVHKAAEERRVRAAEAVRVQRFRVDATRERVAKSKRAEEAAALVPAAQEREALEAASLEASRVAVDTLREEQAGRSVRRIGSLRRGHEAVLEAELLKFAQNQSRGALQVERDESAAERDYEERFADARAVHREASVRHAEARAELDRVTRLAASVDNEALSALESEENRLVDALSEQRDADASHLLAIEGCSKTATALQYAELGRNGPQHFLSAANAALLKWPRNIADVLAGARSRLEELETQIAAALEEVSKLAEGAPKSVAAGHAADCAERTRSQKLAVSDARKRVATLTTAAGLADHSLEAARTAQARREELQQQKASRDELVADWTRLAADLGRDGLQAYEIDAAVPELTTLVNDLLHECVSTRWTISIETARMDASGKKSIEGLEVRVLDTEKGRDGRVETFSGGERVLIGEAVSLGLTMLACRRSGETSPTLIRDESGAALDAEKSRAYVSMLRRAARLVGAHRVLLVSHSAEVIESCDSRVTIADGTAVIS